MDHRQLHVRSSLCGWLTDGKKPSQLVIVVLRGQAALYTLLDFNEKLVKGFPVEAIGRGRHLHKQVHNEPKF